jgi:two-component system sensor histidine kinase KdpD
VAPRDDDARPDPDRLLATVVADRARVGRARFKLYFGAAPGVGKTYAMLEGAHRLRAAGVDVVVGCVETHGRRDTTTVLGDLPVLPRREVEHRGITLTEFDLAAALARRPAVILIDELAHRNAPGSVHMRRWQDVLELLDAGIEVHATLNVQHVESLRDVVEQLTGVRVQETVPDAVLERVDELELIDLPAEELQARLRDGKVYVADAAVRALEGFFQRGNLLALRELALRKTAERVDADAIAHRRAHGLAPTRGTHERILVAVGASPGSAGLVRATRRIADALHAPWTVATVDVIGQPPLAARDRARLEEHLRLAETLGAEVLRLGGTSVADALLAHARAHGVTRIVCGKPTHARWRDRLVGSLLDALIRGSGAIDVHVIAPPDATGAPPARPAARAPTRPPPHRWAIASSLLAVAAVTAIGLAAEAVVSIPDVAMLYLLAIMVAALGGRAPALVAATASVLAFDFCFVPPRFTFAVDDLRYLMTFLVMFVVGVATSDLVVRLRRQQAAGLARERRTAALLAFSRDLARLDGAADVAAALAAQLEDAFGVPAAVMVPDPREGLIALAGLPPMAAAELTVVRWALDHHEEAGASTATLPGASVLALPLLDGERALAVVAVARAPSAGPLPGEQRYLVDGLLRQAALALSRAELARVARDAAVQASAEALRATLLATVSHDLRTPLAVITGATSTLRARHATLAPAAQAELVEAIDVEARRLERVLGNLLELTRVEAGLEPRRSWTSAEELIGAALGRLDDALADVALALDVPVDLWLAVDPVLMEQVLLNLIDNALKHGAPPLAISAALDDDGVSVRVRDHGAGVPTGFAAHAFDKFARGETSGAPGLGLGLAVSRAIVVAHGGTLELAPAPDGGGAEFVVRLPTRYARIGTPPPEVTP